MYVLFSNKYRAINKFTCFSIFFCFLRTYVANNGYI